MATNWITKNEVNGGNRGTTKGGAALVVVGGLEVSTGAGIPLGVGKISMGLFGLTTAIADVSQGTQDIGYGWNGDSTTPNSNFIRDSLFGGNDERYGIVSTLVGAVGMYVGFVNYPMLAETSAGALIPGRGTNNGYTHQQNLEGLKEINNHLSDDVEGFEFEPNKAMINKIEEMINNGEPLSGAYKDFYEHELTESMLMKQGYDYNTAHNMALDIHEVQPQQLYSPEIIKNYPQWFNKLDFEFWGIDPN